MGKMVLPCPICKKPFLSADVHSICHRCAAGRTEVALKQAHDPSYRLLLSEETRKRLEELEERHDA